MKMLDRVTSSAVTVVVINFGTPDLTRRAAESFRSFYPLLPLLLIDNGSQDESRRTLEELRALGCIPFAGFCTDPCDGRTQGTTGMMDSLPSLQVV